MNVHKNARLTMHGRVLLVRRVVEEDWTVVAASEAAGVSVRTGFKWLARFRAGGERMLHDRSSAPARRPSSTPIGTVATIEELRRQRLTGPAIARRLGMPRATVGLILRRIGLGRLTALESKLPANRYERERPGDLIHVDTKKLGRIDGIGHRMTGDRRGQSSKRGTGWEVLHVAIDDASRLAYTEILADEKTDAVCAFTDRALSWFARHGVTVARLMSDNGSAYKSHVFRRFLANRGVRHIRTRPYTPRTNGKAERFIQTTLREWAYAAPYASSRERTEAMPTWLDDYNLVRPHSAHNGLAPWTRLNNLLGNDI
ncbi:IS481 family transposase [Chelatococcus asaccharovorans]|uniref:Transposase IS481 family protein n=1 Tax=Chelatococcus asaccharovorans TaxID=28210 RepID=A0A2V3U2B9_9HYPH|nr:IS481 family transposase [Chelatococcus asaccharovorans]MBS7702422.1 IS481 family transposase [Chelatococcus asaccharovorans]PXW56373.1 transposase IS481 family protein [Chelatococcus asaccharovorans]